MGKVIVKNFRPKVANFKWYLVANQRKARIFQDQEGKKAELIEVLENPEAKLLDHELISDRPGRSYASAKGSAIKHSLDRRWKKQEEIIKRFARLINAYLRRVSLEATMDELVVAAEPKFLGILRKALDPKFKKLIKIELPHEYLGSSTANIRKRVLADHSKWSSSPSI